jgi:hypothetical protein
VGARRKRTVLPGKKSLANAIGLSVQETHLGRKTKILRTKILTTNLSSPTNARWLSRQRLIIPFWIAAIISVAVMATTGPAGWDARNCGKAIQSLRHGGDPYAEGIAAQQAFHNRPASSAAEHAPLTYVYSPLTLPLLRLLAALPDGMLAVLFWAAVAAGFLLELWAGYEMAAEHERPWLALLLPVVAFFPGLITDDVILSGNVAYILYGPILMAAVLGWRRGRWFWYYLAVLAASICKAPFLTLLAFPILVGRRQWFPAGSTAAAGLLLIAAQARLWPKVFSEYLSVLRLMFDDAHDFGYGPAGVLGRALWKMGRPYSSATIILYLAFAGALGIALLLLARHVRQENLSRETWIPIALVGTFLLNPRIMKYDMAAITIPMLLIGWRTLRKALNHSSSGYLLRSPRLIDDQPAPGTSRPLSGAPGQHLSILTLSLIGAACFLVPNTITVVGPTWWPVELAVMLGIFTIGISSLHRTSLKAQPSIVPARVVYEEVAPLGAVESIM